MQTKTRKIASKNASVKRMQTKMQKNMLKHAESTCKSWCHGKKMHHLCQRYPISKIHIFFALIFWSARRLSFRMDHPTSYWKIFWVISTFSHKAFTQNTKTVKVQMLELRLQLKVALVFLAKVVVDAKIVDESNWWCGCCWPCKPHPQWTFFFFLNERIFHLKRDLFNRKGSSSNRHFLGWTYVNFQEGTASLHHRFLKVDSPKKEGIRSHWKVWNQRWFQTKCEAELEWWVNLVTMVNKLQGVPGCYGHLIPMMDFTSSHPKWIGKTGVTWQEWRPYLC